MSELKLRPGDQPLPVPNVAPDIQSQVIADIERRRQVGIRRYGIALQPGNGRDALRDAYEEVLDLACYLRQEMVERSRLEPSALRDDIAAAMTTAWNREAIVCDHTQRIPLGLLADAAMAVIRQRSVPIEERGLALVDKEDLAKAAELRDTLLALRGQWETRRRALEARIEAADLPAGRDMAIESTLAQVVQDLDRMLDALDVRNDATVPRGSGA